MAYIQHAFMTEAERAEVKRKGELQDELKRLGETQSLIRLKLEIALRGGLTKDLRDQISEAAQSYGEAFDNLMNSCPVQQKAIGRR